MKVYVIKNRSGEIHSIYGEYARQGFDYATDAIQELEKQSSGEWELTTMEIVTDITTDGCRCTLCGGRWW